MQSERLGAVVKTQQAVCGGGCPENKTTAVKTTTDFL